MTQDPATDACTFDVSHEGEIYVVSVLGSLADDAHRRGKEIFLQVLGQSPKRILVDLEGMEFISSSGIGLLVSILKRCRQRGVSLPLCGLRAEVLELFRLTRLNQIFEIHDNRSAALAAR